MQNHKSKFKTLGVISALFLVILPLYLIFSLYFLDKNYFLCPVEYKMGIVVRSDNRGDGFFQANRNGRRVHRGIDLASELNSPVVAARSGRVIVAKNEERGMGNYIVIRHPGNITTLYGHLSKIYVGQNQFVRQGQIIGKVGKTGNANYPDIQTHLHFEVRKDGILQDPLEYLE